MTCTFAGRVEQLEILRRAMRRDSPGLVMITGEPGMGRSALLVRALEFTDPARDVVAWLEPARKRPFTALRTGCALPTSAARADVVRAIANGAEGRRVVMAADDGHLMDLESLLVMRDLSRSGDALLLVTCPPIAGACAQPNPTDSLWYEKGIQLVKLQPLSVGEVATALAGMLGGPVALPTAEALHAASGGNPRDLEALVGQLELASRVVRRDGVWRLGAAGPEAGQPRFANTGLTATLTRIVDAAWQAWRELAAERADQLSRLALWQGTGEGIAPIWAMLLLLRGRAAEALAFVDSLPGENVAMTPRLSLVRALTLAVGLGRVDEASDFLARAADHGDHQQLALAHRTWILALTGRVSQATAALRAVRRDDMETATFVHAARGVLMRIANHPAEAVFHFRRAVATAESGSAGCPWVRPFLRASVIDSLLLSGRKQDAVSVAQRFHAEAMGSGWEVAAALDNLMRRPCLLPAAA